MSDPSSQGDGTRQARWISEPPRQKNVRRLRLALTSCLLATLTGALIAFASLPVNQPETVLVSVYLTGDGQSVGADAPYDPACDSFLGLMPVNRTARSSS
ncbi:MAG: hypothetical protein R3C05_30095, partial [Pirellulaceae bacterium]